MGLTDYRFLFEKYALGKHRVSIEKNVRKHLRKIRGQNFVDIGANRGLYSRLLSKNFVKVYAVEPNPLYHQYGLPINVERLELAFSNVEGEADFYLNTGNGSADTLLKRFPYLPGDDPNMLSSQTFRTERKIRVKTMTYDSLFHNRTVDLVKIDVEGAEFLVLEGMKHSMEAARVKNLMVELHNMDRETELLRVFHRYNFNVKRLDQHPRFLASH